MLHFAAYTIFLFLCRHRRLQYLSSIIYSSIFACETFVIVSVSDVRSHSIIVFMFYWFYNL